MKRFKIIFIFSLVLFQSCNKSSKTDEYNQTETITIYSIGDSTMSDKKNPEVNPEYGWCQVLPQFLNNKVTLENHAVNGRSTRSFINEKRWDSIYNKLKRGDYVFIQFGHNDQKISNPKRFTNPHTAYRYNLIKFIKETLSKGAIPVLFTSIVRRNFNEEGTLVDTHGQYPQEARLVATMYDVSLIDLQYLTEKLEESYGVEESKKLHLHFEPKENSFYPDGKNDNTHLSKLGATEIAKLAVIELKQKEPRLLKYLK